ncbi:uncharacterized protein MYCFIDRAFT_80713 [Pseudocercospora fijiensis CIRAD86]|uniref:Uncharacterized protein n=1 Tax=Pseudocercospora fijiensis (strain CIRAD86) TaxID=383855 RepID=M3AME9_PSEFD|nr:uncharacterized protein MYCFIDRAFT_80713 [Pseudocercospora fijiensis CIRAD86]EME78283.1 hypothetical protein MYCFIDRAFT_80713 [Pseudocercospora fijiensis CIRAD86]
MSKRGVNELFMIDDDEGEDPRNSEPPPRDGPERTGPGRPKAGPPERKRQRSEARSRASTAGATPVVEDLTDDNIMFIEIPGEKLLRLKKEELLDFIKNKGTEIFCEAYEKCLNEKLKTALKDRPDTLRLGNKVKIINRYETVWKKELSTARNLIAKEMDDLEAILPSLHWPSQRAQFQRDFIGPVEQRLARAEKGVKTFAALIRKLQDTSNV